MDFREELVSRFFQALGKPCAWMPWPMQFADTPVGESVEGPSGVFCLRVRDHLAVDASALEPEERAFLRWALSSMRETDEADPIARLRECSTRDLVVSIAGGAPQEPLRQAARTVPVVSYPAHLMAIEWSARVADPSEIRESAEMVKRVAEAYVEVEAWWSCRQAPVVIASISRSALRHAWLSLGHAEMDARGLTALVSQVASAVRSEALIDARVAVSSVIRRAEDAEAGVATLELARREALRRNTDVVVFGDDPVRTALHWLDEPTQTAFLRAVSALSETGLDAWPEGWGEIADAMVRANLNVSEAARSLYMHRNTLLARIEKLRETSGLDVRRGPEAFALLAADALLRGQSALD